MTLSSRYLFLVAPLLLLFSFEIPLPTFADKNDVDLKKDSTPYFLMGQTYEKDDETLFSFETMNSKVILLDFWATWCGPCIKDHPLVETLKTTINHPDFEVVTVSIDRDKEKWQEFLKENNWGGTNITLDPKNMQNPLNQMVVEEFERNGKTLQKTTVPQYFLVDKQLKIEKIDDISNQEVFSLIMKKLENK